MLSRFPEPSTCLPHLNSPAGFAGTCSPTANLKATESEKWRNARVVRPCIGSGTDSRSQELDLLATAHAPVPGLLPNYTFSMKINKDPKDARSRYNLQRHLPRSFFREGKVWKWEDGTVQTFKIGAGAAFQASSVQYSKLFAQRIGAASKRVLPAQTPGLWASGSGSGFGSGDRQLPSAPPSTLIHLQYLLSIAPCCNFCHLQNPNNLVLDTLAPKL
ncbi:uncharacterized protein K444DRAFT_704405 [Hyaloscypha bicolor E]|uniref:Uncharacterized protein n=1 Tax=Hyaloscypha bicolor E TaxID=1095630 RepID=A0A2J6SQ80_9HELO|nr:uncharacterized protein K444DRAFT_704405 [Hyaloscypha bicolor E]PMD52900.1 hypothetical protein K444DRAFT_704405 [Hyaloscypha bicolor E]